LFLDILLVTGGLTCLLLGGEALVRGGVATARILGISPLMIGLTWVAFGTSAPELMVSIRALLANHADIVIGNAVGSNIANILLVMGLAALIMPPSSVFSAIRPQAYSLLGFTFLFVLASFNQEFGWYQGLVMVGLLAFFLYWSCKIELQKSSEERVIAGDAAEMSWPFNQILGDRGFGERNASRANKLRFLGLGLSFVWAIGGLVLLLFGSWLLVDGAASVARTIGVSEAVIGLSLIAIGTSLPELVTSIVAAYRGHVELAVGNIIGSNIFNLFGVVGITALIGTVPVPLEVINIDIWVMAGATALIGAMMLAGCSITRPWSGGLLMIYAIYVSHLWVR
jgi:cation:H+ antiporter